MQQHPATIRPLVRPDLVRAAALCWIAVAAVAIAVSVVQHLQHGLTNTAGEPLGADFINTWTGAALAWRGQAQTVYDWLAYHAFQEQIVGAPLDFYHYSYPPVLLLLAPLGALPYLVALGVWTLCGWFAFYLALRNAFPHHALLFALAAPAVLVNTLGGQNGTWSAALLAGGLWLLPRRPVAAGILFGLLIYKPQLGLLLPIALLAGREGRAFGAAAAMATVLVLASGLLFGFELWPSYLRNAETLRGTILEDGTGVWHRMVSVFVFARRIGFDASGAYAMQLIVAVPVAIGVAIAWWRNWPADLRNALTVVGTCLVTPYLQDYDLVMAVFAAAALLAAMMPHTQMLAVIGAGLLLVVPLLAAPVGLATGLSIGALMLAPVFPIIWMMKRRADTMAPFTSASIQQQP